VAVVEIDVERVRPELGVVDVASEPVARRHEVVERHEQESMRMKVRPLLAIIAVDAQDEIARQ
jgi:hypothetical protein